MTTAISTAGNYGAGDYHLSQNISGALVFTGTATLDMQGHEISGSGSYGIQSLSPLAVTDSVGGAAVTGFWCGVKVEGDGSVVRGLNVTGCMYIGIWLAGDDCEADGIVADGIGGVTDSPYAIAVQCSGARPTVINCSFTELYRQIGYVGSDPGEGLAVNLSSQASDGVVENVSLSNSLFEQDTIGVFVGSGGGHAVDGVTTHNVQQPVRRAQIGPGSMIINVAATYSHNPPSPPPPPSEVWGTIFEETIASSFGNSSGKTHKLHVAAAALTAPTGTPTQIRVTAQATADEPLQIGALYVGHTAAGGDAWDAASLVQLKLGGAGGFTIPEGQSVVLDDADFAWDKTRGLIFSAYVSGDAGTDKVPGKTFADATTWVKYGDTASTADDSGMGTSYGYLTLVTRIETDGF